MPVKLPFSPGFCHFLFRIYKMGGIYGYFLKKTTPVTPLHSPSRGRKGDRQAGVKIISGGFNDSFLDTESHRLDWHSWHWMNDLQSIATPEAQETASKFAIFWIREFAQITSRQANPEIWEAKPLATRICEWIYCWQSFLAEEDEAIKTEINQSFGAQIFHLLVLSSHFPKDLDHLICYKALILCCLCGLLDQKYQAGFEEELKHFISHNQLPDGGMGDRNPEHAAIFLEHLSDLRMAYQEIGQEVPGFMQQALDRSASFLKFIRFNDNRLPHFQGAKNPPAFKLVDILKRSGFDGAAAISAPHSGYEKMQAGKTEIVMDCGGGPYLKDAQKNYHASVGAVEIYLDKQPVIINCGDVSLSDSHWIMAQRSSSAHSTAILAETNIVELTKTGLGKRIATVSSSHEEEDQGSLITIQHDGYQKNWGLTHKRQVFLFPDGNDIRGLDQFNGHADSIPQNFKIRFHLHPTVQVSLMQNNKSALLKLPTGEGWRLRSDGAELSIEDSYFCDLGIQRATRQIVLSGLAKAGQTDIKWAFQLES